jgi:hypothetical protein
MTLILNENGKIENITTKSIDSLKREQYGHSEEKTDDIESFVNSLELIEKDEEDVNSETETNLDVVEIAMQFAEFKVNFVKQFGEEELPEAFGQFEDFFSSKGVDTTVDLSGLDADDEGIPGMESSEQSIMTSEVGES